MKKQEIEIPPLITDGIGACTRLASISVELLDSINGKEPIAWIPKEKIDQLPKLPDWCHNILKEFNKSIYKGLHEQLKPKKTDDNFQLMHKFGIGRGILHRFELFLENDLPRILGEVAELSFTKKQEEVLENFFVDYKEFPMLVEFAEALESEEEEDPNFPPDFDDSSKVSQALPNVNIVKTGIPADDMRYVTGFYSGFSKGMTLLIDENGNWSGESVRFPLLFELLASWVEIEAMRNARPPKTREYLYDWLKRYKDVNLGTLSAFEKTLQLIKLRMNQGGRPKGSKNKPYRKPRTARKSTS